VRINGKMGLRRATLFIKAGQLCNLAVKIEGNVRAWGDFAHGFACQKENGR